MRSLIVAVCALGALSLSALATGCSSVDEGAAESSSDALSMSTSDIIARAQEWVDKAVPYCGGARGSGDALCGGTCWRPAAAWDNYRSDCSGFVSWCWQIKDQPSTDGYIRDRGGADGWVTIGIDDLQSGDALVSDGHIKLFSRFTSPNAAEIYEEYDCGRVARKAVQSFSRNGKYVYFAYDNRAYHAIRRTSVTGGAVTPVPSQPSCRVYDDGKLHCDNKNGAPIRSAPTNGSGVVDHLRSTNSWFDCWSTGDLHAGGNTTWYHTQGDDHGAFGWVAAADMSTPNDFDADPQSKGLARCK